MTHQLPLLLYFYFNTSFSNITLLPFSVFPFVRRQRHANPSPAQAVAQATEEDGHAKGAGQAGTKSAAGSHV